MLCTATPDISSSSKNFNSAARVSRLSFCFLWLWLYVVLQINGLKLIYVTENSVSVIGFKSNLRTLTCRVLQGSVEFHFAHDTNILHINKSPKMLNKLIKIWQTGLLSKKLHKIFQKLNWSYSIQYKCNQTSNRSSEKGIKINELRS